MLLTFAAAGLCFGSARADLPVHCLRHQIAGDWDFHLGPLSADRSSCGHLSPDSQDHQPKVALTQTVDVKQVSLENPNVVRTSSSEGHWTMIYDEGFEVNVDGLSFFAFSRFDLHNVGGVKTNVSRCGETQLGWYHDLDTGRWGCYFGRRRGDDSLHASLLAMAPARGRSSDSAPESNRDPKGPAYDEPLGSLHHDAFVAGLNLVQEAWSAKTYERLIGKSLRELNAMAGIFRPFRRDEQLAQQQAAGPHGAPSFLQTRQRASPEGRLRSALGSDAGKLPAAWDWRNVSGASYVDPLMDQGDCGSCYVVSTVHMLSSRHRIRQRDPTLDAFSIEFPLKCSEYTQGCDGGYAFLVSRWSQDVGLVPRSCGEYAGTAGSCSLRCSVGDLGKRWRADNHRYVGGYYGAAAEREMMRELVEGGPIVASFEPKPDFMYYSGGVYKSVPSQRMEWEQVDHAVLLVGYGEENGQKYWTLQNSWGRDWGEDGFFRMARGTDESGIESIVVAADVVEDTRPGMSLLAFAQQQSS